MTGVLDTRGRPLTDLRISLTDRCNLRCTYCMPRALFGPGHAFLAPDALLTFDEIEEIVRVGHALGVAKVRLTGGEPLLRPGVEHLVARLAAIGGLDLAMTTNGVLLPRLARPLADAGLSRLTVSLDALDDATFQRASDSRFRVQQVLDGISSAEAAGFTALKINTVVRSGLNDSQILDLVGHFRDSGHVLRFIEYMDVGSTNGWQAGDVVSSAAVLAVIAARWPVQELPPARTGEVARRYRLTDGSLEFGLISSITQPFCATCNRARVTADGRLHTCLFSTGGLDLMPVLRGPRTDGDLLGLLTRRWAARDDRYSELRGRVTDSRRTPVEMSYLGG